jgi:chromosome segregation ATPase
MSMQDFSVEAAVVVSLIEIREAIEENTAVQQAIMDQARKVSEETQELVGTLVDLGADMQAAGQELAAQRAVMDELVKDIGGHAARLEANRKQLAIHTGILNRLADDKQDRPEVLNGPDTAREGG